MTTMKVGKRKRRRKSRVGVVLKNVIDYLKTDSYMYAPLCSSPPILLSSNRTEVSLLKKEEGNKNFNLGAKVFEYLKSDDYMYAPLLLLLLHQPSNRIHSSPSPRPQLEAEEVMESPTTPASYKENKNMNIQESTSRVVGSRIMWYHHPEGGAVKHSVHQNTLSVMTKPNQLREYLRG